MGFKYVRELPSVENILESMPLSPELKAVKVKRDSEISDIFCGKSSKFILIIGPCSAHDEEALCEYVAKLARLQEKVRDKILMIPRIYTNKPRTTGVGYKGMLHQPDHKEEPDIVKGLQAIRKMHIRAFSESHLPSADEMLYPENYPYLADILSYVAVGARSVENQQHRLTISGLDIPSGMKNPTSGDFKVMLDSIYAAQKPHTFVYNRFEVETTGNKLAHAIVRGAVDREGNHIPNYHFEDLEKTSLMYKSRDLENPAIIVDTNHSNSGKKYDQQPRISTEVMWSREHSEIIRGMVKGLMIESFLLDGAQSSDGDEFGKSITDPCLGWPKTEKLVMELAELA